MITTKKYVTILFFFIPSSSLFICAIIYGFLSTLVYLCVCLFVMFSLLSLFSFFFVVTEDFFFFLLPSFFNLI